MDGFGTFDHTADLGLLVDADSLEGLFSTALAGLMELMVSGPRDGEVTWLPLELTGQDTADLLVQALNEAVYLLDGEGLVAVALEPDQLGPTRLAGRLGVVPFDPSRNRLGQGVKAVTYHQARVERTIGGWQARLVADV